MFCTISVLWSLWSTESLATWLSLWSAARDTGRRTGQGWIVALLTGGACRRRALRGGEIPRTGSRTLWPRSAITRQAGGSSLASRRACALVSSSRVSRRSRDRRSTLIAAVRFGGLNQADHAGLERGYYENLMGVDRFNGELWSLYMNRPADWDARPGRRGPVARRREGSRRTSWCRRWRAASRACRCDQPLGPARQGVLQDSARARLPDRMAVLGASHAMGSGVAREDTFEAVLEDRLNRNLTAPGEAIRDPQLRRLRLQPAVPDRVLETRCRDSSRTPCCTSPIRRTPIEWCTTWCRWSATAGRCRTTS